MWFRLASSGVFGLSLRSSRPLRFQPSRPPPSLFERQSYLHSWRSAHAASRSARVASGSAAKSAARTEANIWKYLEKPQTICGPRRLTGPGPGWLHQRPTHSRCRDVQAEPDEGRRKPAACGFADGKGRCQAAAPPGPVRRPHRGDAAPLRHLLVSGDIRARQHAKLAPAAPWRLPDKQKDKLAVFRGEPSTFSTAYSKADYVRNEIWSARTPVINMAEGIDGPVRRDLHVPPNSTMPRAVAYARAFDRIAASPDMGDGVSGGFAHGVKRIGRARLIRHIESAFMLVGPKIAQRSCPS